MITACLALEGGYCRQLLATIDRKSWRWVRFHAVFLVLEHKHEGLILVDTGYGDAFHRASRTFPYRLYRWATPVTANGSTTARLTQAGINPSDIRHVIITHFHADHIGGLAEFPHARIHHHAGALAPLAALSPWRQVRAAFLPGLVPPWLPRQASAIPSSAFVHEGDELLRTHDLFGDRSLRLVDLPGHAPGQIGVLFNSPRGQEFYAADAYWRKTQLTTDIEPLGIAMSLQWDRAAYRKTINTLKALEQAGHHHLSACHDDGTAAALSRRFR